MNTQDILNLTLSGCAIILTIGITYIIINAAIIIKRIRKTIEIITSAILNLEQFAEFIKEKITNTSTYVPLIVEATKKLVSFIEDKKKNK
jgi:hypothetical protein